MVRRVVSTRFWIFRSHLGCPDWFVSDHILVGEGIREAVAFVSHQLEESPLAAGRHFAMDRVLQESDDSSTAYRFIKPFVERGGRAAVQNAPPPFWVRAILHLTKGSALVGIVSVFYSFVGESRLPEFSARAKVAASLTAQVLQRRPLSRRLVAHCSALCDPREGGDADPQMAPRSHNSSLSRWVYLALYHPRFQRLTEKSLPASSSWSGSSRASGRSTGASSG